MRFQSAASVLTAVAVAGVAAQGPVTGAQGNATAVNNNPAGVVYIATLPSDAFFKPAFPNGGNIKGEIAAVASPDGKGVQFKVKFSNLPAKELGPFTYHIHVAPVPADGNCTAALAHLDPFIRGEDPPCDSAHPETCQVGDLSGKFGKVTGSTFEQTYHDNFASTKEGLGGFFGNRSFVFHYPNKTRISCANFKVAQGQTTLPSQSSDGNSTTPAPTGSGPSKPTQTFATAGAGALQSTVWGVGAASLFAAIAFML